MKVDNHLYTNFVIGQGSEESVNLKNLEQGGIALRHFHTACGVHHKSTSFT